MALRRKVPAGTRVADPVFPNAGVEAWYRERLQSIVLAMWQDMRSGITGAWTDGGGIAHDGRPTLHAAGVVFRASLGRILLLLRSDGKGWGLPGGGMEPGETEQEAAARECREEMGLRIAPSALEWLCVQRWHNVRFATFTVDAVVPFMPTLNDEHTDHAWITPRDAMARLPMHPAVLPTLEFLLAGDALAADAKLTTPVLLRRALSKWGDRWAKRINAAAEKISLDFAVKNRNATQRSMFKTLRDAGFTVKFKASPAARQAFEAVVAENVGLIRSIPQKFLADVQTAVWQNVMQGSDLGKLTDSLYEKYEIAHRRAALIARDQNHKAKAALERADRAENGITEAVWMHSNAGVEPRPTHVAMDGQKYSCTEGMWDSAVHKRIWPGTEINCRCTDRAVIPGFA